MKHSKPTKRRSAQYDHMMGNPLDPSMHPATLMPDATNAYTGQMAMQVRNPMNPPSPDDFDNTVG